MTGELLQERDFGHLSPSMPPTTPFVRFSSPSSVKLCATRVFPFVT